MNTVELGKKYKCNPGAISDRLKKNNINVTKSIILPMKQIINEYNNGMSTIELGKKYKCSYSTIYNNLKKYNVQLRTNNESKILELPIEQIIEEYKNGISTIELAEKYNCSRVTISKKLKKNNINITKIINLPIKQIINEYNSGITINKLAEKYNCSPKTISNRLKENNIDIIIFFLSSIEEKQLIIDYKNGISVNKLAEKYNCSLTTIYDRLKKNNINIIKFSDPLIKQLIIDYENGISVNKLAEKYNCGITTIYSKFKENNINIPNLSNLPIKQIIDEYKSGINTIELSRKYNCCHATIKRRLKNNDVSIRTRKEVSNTLSIHICIKCGNEFLGKTVAIYCDNCDPNEYCDKYNKECKEHNREKYDRECFFCGKSEEENGRKHDTHHVDNNKNQGCDEIPWKLVPLCKSCHGFTKGGIENRLIWEARIMWLLEHLGDNL